MKIMRLWFSLAISLLVLVTWAFAQMADESLPEADYIPDRFRVFAAGDVEDTHKLQIATNVESLSESEIDFLHTWIKEDAGVGRLYALTTLATVKDPRSPPHIGQALLANDNRYYALALGLIGDERGIPYLRNTLLQSERNHVQRACKIALRMLGALDTRNLEPPGSTVDGDISIALTASTNSLSVGDEFTLVASVQNMSDEPTHILWPDVFFGTYLKVYSTSGEFIIPAHIIFDYQLSSNSLHRIEAGAEVQMVEQCRLLVTAPDRTEWKEVLSPQDVFYLDAGSWAHEVGLYDAGKTIGIQLVIVYEPSYPHWLSQFGVQVNEVVQVRVVSNTLELNISSSKGLLEGTED